MGYVVIAKWTAKDGEEDAVGAVLTKMIKPSRAEPGNLTYQIHRDPEDPRAFLIYEEYVDAAAYTSHGNSAHFQQHAVNDGIPRLSSRERTFLVTWEGD